MAKKAKIFPLRNFAAYAALAQITDKNIACFLAPLQSSSLALVKSISLPNGTAILINRKYNIENLVINTVFSISIY